MLMRRGARTPVEREAFSRAAICNCSNQRRIALRS
jgi:hypothetical protein